MRNEGRCLVIREKVWDYMSYKLRILKVHSSSVKTGMKGLKFLDVGPKIKYCQIQRLKQLANFRVTFTNHDCSNISTAL